jgi:hypothetical protein
MKNCVICKKEFNRPPKGKRTKCFECNPITRRKNDRLLEIIRLREEGICQNQIAKILGMSKATISYWCSGEEAQEFKFIPTAKRYCECGKQVKGISLKCFECISADRPIKELMYSTGPQSNTYIKIRSRARTKAKQLGIMQKGCVKCGYNKHVEVCHIKPISSFDISTMLSVVNDVSNLIVLCPNCHWEFDHP